MSRYAIVQNGIVTNVVVWDGKAEWPHEGDAIKSDNKIVGPGWTYDATAKPPFIDPNPYEEPEA